MAKELTLQQARENSSSFLYIFASDQYLKYIPAKYATIIKGKRANQRKLLTLSAQAYINKDAVYGGSEYKQYVNAVSEGFEATYGMTPAEALVKLALGETVAGKNWEQGVYGVGALYPATFYGTNISVNPDNGHIIKDGTDYTDESKTVYDNFGKKIGTIPSQLFATIGETTYMSQYYKIGKKYYAKAYSTASGSFSAKNGSKIEKIDAGSVFENIQLGSWDFLDFLKSLFSFFGISFNNDDKEQINETNTLPNQQTDGYVQDSPQPLESSAILAAVAAGALIIGKLMPNRGGKKKK